MRRLARLMLIPLLVAVGTPAFAETSTDNSGVMLAQKAKKKGKKKKKAEAEDDGGDFGPTDIDPVSREATETGIGVHREQEGIDRPYLAEVSGLTTVSLLTEQAGDGDPVKSTDINIGGELLFILGSFEVGPALNYISESSQYTSTVIDADDKETSTTYNYKASYLGFGGVFKLNFGDIDHSDLVPFVYGGVAYLSGNAKDGDADAVKTTGTEFRFGGGVNFFLDSNVSFQPRAQYLLRSTKADTDGAEASKTSGLELLFGLGTFI